MKPLILILTTLTLLTLLDLSPMFYQRLFGNGGTYVEYYSSDLSPDSLLKTLRKEFSAKNINKGNPYIYKILPDRNGSHCTYIELYTTETSEYIHLWVNTDTSWSSTATIVFYGISKSSDFNDSRIINRDYDYIFKELTTRQFERLIMNKLKQRSTNA